MADTTFDQLMKRAKALQGFAPDAAKTASMDADRDKRFAQIEKDIAGPVQPAPSRSKVMQDMQGGSPALNKAIDIADAVKMGIRGPSNAPWWTPALSTVGEAELGGKALGLIGDYIAKPAMRGIGRAIGAADEYFGGPAQRAASQAAKRASTSGATPTLNDVIRPGMDGWVPEPDFAAGAREATRPSTRAANIWREDSFHLPYNTPYVPRDRAGKAARGAVKGITDALESDPLRMSLDEESQLADIMPELQAKIDQLRPSHDSWARPSSDLTSGSIFRQAPEEVPFRESPMASLARGESRDVLSLPRDQYTQGLGRGLERGPNPITESQNPVPPSMRNSTKGVFTASQERGMAQLQDLLERIHGEDITIPNGGPGRVGNGLVREDPMAALAKGESGDVLSLPRSKYTQGMGRGFDKAANNGGGTVIRETPVESLARNDEASKRTSMFGGVRPEGKMTAPKDRKPISLLDKIKGSRKKR